MVDLPLVNHSEQIKVVNKRQKNQKSKSPHAQKFMLKTKEKQEYTEKALFFSIVFTDWYRLLHWIYFSLPFVDCTQAMMMVGSPS